MVFDDDIIWDNPDDDKKRRNKPSRQSKNTQPEPEIPPEQPVEQHRPAQPRTSQEQAQSFLRAEQIYQERRRRSNNRPLSFSESFWGGFEGAFMTSHRYRSRLRFARFMSGLFIIFLFFAFDGVGFPFRIRPDTVRPRRERVQQETRTQENVQSQQQTYPQTSRLNDGNRVLYLKNFSVVSQVILLLKSEGRYCSFTSLGLANCFATQLNAFTQSGNVLHLADGTTYTFDCENQKCTLNVGLGSNNAEVMPIPLSADADGNIVINRNDVAKFLND